MPRPKSYDRREAVEKACKAFWAQGFQSLGVRELEQLTGINQFAIRSEFGGKEGLYLEALKFYCDEAISLALEPRRNGGLADVIDFMSDLGDETSPMSSPWGCLVVNTGIENARIRSARLETAVTSYWRTLEAFFHDLLRNAQARREISADIDCDAIAKGLVTAVMGVHAQNRNRRSSDAGRQLVELVCAHLRSLQTGGERA